MFSFVVIIDVHLIKYKSILYCALDNMTKLTTLFPQKDTLISLIFSPLLLGVVD